MLDKKYALLGLITVCITALWMVQDSLCEFEYHTMNANILAKLAYEVK